MLVFPCAKINLGLNVVRRRADGYHDIESVLVPIPLCDALEADVDPALEAGQVAVTRIGRPVPGDAGDDLVARAYRLVLARHPLPGLQVHLHKAIPIGAGLGGGSSDTNFLKEDGLEKQHRRHNIQRDNTCNAEGCVR